MKYLFLVLSVCLSVFASSAKARPGHPPPEVTPPILTPAYCRMPNFTPAAPLEGDTTNSWCYENYVAEFNLCEAEYQNQTLVDCDMIFVWNEWCQCSITQYDCACVWGENYTNFLACLDNIWDSYSDCFYGSHPDELRQVLEDKMTKAFFADDADEYVRLWEEYNKVS